MIVILSLLGRMLDARARHRSGDAIRQLLALSPPRCLRVGADGRTTEIPLGEVMPGDLLRVLPGQRLSADGIVTRGQGSVSEALLTGEPMPIDERRGAKVHGGTLNAVRTSRSLLPKWRC